MFDKLEALEERFALVSEKISDPEVIADQESWRKFCKEHSDLTPIIDKYRELKAAKQTIADDKEMLEDFVTMAVNAALKQAQETSDNEMNKLTSGLNIPGLF